MKIIKSNKIRRMMAIAKYKTLWFFLAGGSSICTGGGIGSSFTGAFLIFILNGGSRKLNLGTDIYCTSLTYIGRWDI